MALIVKVDGSEEVRDVKGYEDVSDIIGGWIQLVPVSYKEYNYLLCDEEGKLKGLQINERATQMVVGQLLPFDFLVGTIVFLKRGELE